MNKKKDYQCSLLIVLNTNIYLFDQSYLKSFGLLSTRLHFEHSATFLSLPLSNKVFITTSPPHEQKNLWVVIDVREFLLAPAIFVPPENLLSVYNINIWILCQ